MSWERLTYYNPMLDPALIEAKMTDPMALALETGKYDDGTVEHGGPLEKPDVGHPANLISSLCTDGLHRPALDIDIGFDMRPQLDEALMLLGEHCGGPAEINLVSSTTFYHYYIDGLAFGLHDYMSLVHQLAYRFGLVEKGYYFASKNRGQTLLRLPHVRKSS